MRRLLAALTLLFVLGCSSTPDDFASLRAYIESQMADKGLPAVSIALVDDQEIVFAEGFGHAAENVPATADTVYRVGSVSKLYTDIAVMQLVEQGRLDLDAPVTTYLPDFHPQGDGAEGITVRHLMSHRAGIVREPPVGSYFDDSEPSIAEIVASLNGTELVYPVGSRTRYSNAGLVVVGAVVQSVAGKPFADHIEEAVLRPLGMKIASFRRPAAVAEARMWSYDGRDFAAPTFDVLVPAGNLYSSMREQAELLRAVFRGGSPVLQPETLRKMTEPQFDAKGDYGLGFALGEFEGRRQIGHGGAVYGFSTDLRALPDEKLGVVASASRDVTNDVVRRITAYAMQILLARREGRTAEPPVPTEPVDEATKQKVVGRYGSETLNIRLVDREGDLWTEGIPYHRLPVRRSGEGYETDGRLDSGTKIAFGDDTVKITDVEYKRLPDEIPPEPPAAWKELIGEYGPDYNTLFILEREGQLCVLIEWVFLYPLTEVGPDEWAFPDFGLYHGERIRFERDAAGRVVRAREEGIPFERRPIAEAGTTFRIEPIRPVYEIREEALTAEPPPQAADLLAPDLVDLTTLDPTIQLDIRYATTNNFMGVQFYPEGKAFMQRPAAEALVRAHRALAEQGYGLLIHDAYRPWYVTKMFFEATPDEMKGFVADPSQGSVHNRGAAVDLTLYDLKTKLPADMPSGYDEFSERAYPEYVGGTSRQRWLRELLRKAMEAEGFTVYPLEWWHFNYKDAQKYPVLNLKHAELKQ